MEDKELSSLAEQCIKEFVSASQSRNMYGAAHSITRKSLERIKTIIDEMRKDRSVVTFGIIGDEMIFEKLPLYETNRSFATFIKHLKTLGIEKISFCGDVAVDDLDKFLGVLVDAGAKNDPGETLRLFESSGVTTISLGHIGLASGENVKGIDGSAYDSAKNNFSTGVDFLKETVSAVGNGKPVDARAARAFINKVVGGILENRSSFLMLTSLKKRDEYTFIHSINVAIFTLVAAESLGIPKEFLADLGIAALLHDTGKIMIEAELLRKKERLSPDDMDKIRTHPTDGAKALILSQAVPPLVPIVSFEHHLRYDNDGYPKRRYGKGSHPASLLVSIADVYDALRSKRAYRDEMPPEKVYEDMIKSSGTHFHPQMLEHFFSVIGIYPPGTLVELDDGSVGLVVRENKANLHHPIVEVLYDDTGEKVLKPYMINLLEANASGDGFKRNIARSLTFSTKYDLPNRYYPD